MLRILVIHPEEVVRRAIGDGLRRASAEPLSLHEAPSLAEGVRRSSHLEPNVVLIDLSEEQDLALDVARELRRPDRLIIGLYNPLVPRLGEAEFFRRAARAGVGDFIPLPASENELGEALAAVPESQPGTAARSEGRLVTFFSHKGGVGTTTLAVNTALALAVSGSVDRGVALCDAAVQFGATAALLGLTPDHDLADVVREIDDLGAIATHLMKHEETGLSLLASPRDPRQAAVVSPESLCRVLIALRRRFGLVVVDTPSSLDLLSLSVLDLSDAILVVTEAVAPTLAATARLLDVLEDQGFGGDRIRVVLSRYAHSKTELPARTVTELLGHSVDYVVAHDEGAKSAANRGVPLVLGRQETEFSKAVRQIAEDLLAGMSGLAGLAEEG